jgi:hypothetical protein
MLVVEVEHERELMVLRTERDRMVVVMEYVMPLERMPWPIQARAVVEVHPVRLPHTLGGLVARAL